MIVEIRFLNNIYSSSCFDRRDKAEWPPHPARLFSALVKELHESSENKEESQLEVKALDSLAALEPPIIHCSDGAHRRTLDRYVPINDPKKYEYTEHFRVKQLRYCPEFIPETPVVYFEWEDLDADITRTLDIVLKRVSRLGHSATLVACSIVSNKEKLELPSLKLVPSENSSSANSGSSVKIRVPYEDLRTDLEKYFDHHGGTNVRVMPNRIISYTREYEAKDASAFHGDWTVFRIKAIKGLQPNIKHTARVAKAVRNALLSFVDTKENSDNLPELPALIEIISGHPEKSASPTTKDHLAIVPLSDVAHSYAKGRMIGVALFVPSTCAPSLKTVAQLAFERFVSSTKNELTLGANWKLQLVDTEWDALPVALREDTWVKSRTQSKASIEAFGSLTEWRTVTPVVLDRHPGNLFSSKPAVREKAIAEAIESIKRSCVHIGLPEPVFVDVDSYSCVSACPPALHFAERKDSNAARNRVLVHARLRFADDVLGPIVIGAGRYRGLGLFRPFLLQVAIDNKASGDAIDEEVSARSTSHHKVGAV